LTSFDCDRAVHLDDLTRAVNDLQELLAVSIFDNDRVTLVTLVPDTASRMRIAMVYSIEDILRSLSVLVRRQPGLLDNRLVVLGQHNVRVLVVALRHTTERSEHDWKV
jgi:hypothetical protein